MSDLEQPNFIDRRDQGMVRYMQKIISSSNDDIEDVSLQAEELTDLNDTTQDVALVRYSGQDFDVEGLVRRMQNEDILIPTFGHADNRISTAGFQRSFVWRRPQMDKFIESLLLGYPIPGIFLIRQQDKRYLVLDGQQRLRTLQHFYSGTFGDKVFALQNVGDNFKGKTYKTLLPDEKRVLDNSFLQAIIIDSDGSSKSLEAMYQIFERLNSGGTQLTPHEIRVALYAGPFIDFVERLNQYHSWRNLYGKRSPRIRDQELVLRILALFESADKYTRPLKLFLNSYVAERREMDDSDFVDIKSLFERSTDLLDDGPGPGALRPVSGQVNAAYTEAIVVAVMRKLVSTPDLSGQKVSMALEKLDTNSELMSSIRTSTADEESVKVRLKVATSALKN